MKYFEIYRNASYLLVLSSEPDHWSVRTAVGKQFASSELFAKQVVWTRHNANASQKRHDPPNVIYLHKHSAIYPTTFMHFHESLDLEADLHDPWWYRARRSKRRNIKKKKKKKRKKTCAQHANPLTREKCMQARGVNLFGFRRSRYAYRAHKFSLISHTRFSTKTQSSVVTVETFEVDTQVIGSFSSSRNMHYCFWLSNLHR